MEISTSNCSPEIQLMFIRASSKFDIFPVHAIPHDGLTIYCLQTTFMSNEHIQPGLLE